MLEEIRAFRLRLQERVAERRVATPHGSGLFCDSLPRVYDVNFVRAEQPAPVGELIADADAAMEGFFHRRVVTEAAGGRLASAFAAQGWSCSTHLVMAHVREPDRIVETAAVREVPLEAIEPAHRRATLAEPYGDEDLAHALFEAKRRVSAAIDTRWFAAFQGGEVTAYCELRRDGRISQIEDVNTLAAYRGRGLGRAIVQHALQEGRRTSEVVFLEALADDWPKKLYAKLGFEAVDERHLYLRAPHPLSGLVLRTPRLELRLGTVAELRALARTALAGIHDPETMPFEQPWTDTLTEESFLAHHEQMLATSTPADWHLNLIAFSGGEPIGSQGIGAKDFARHRTVQTGSWLGRAWQGIGLGTEMRAAVLSLAFDGLGADLARSGAIGENERSLGVSRKLGYERTGSHPVSPRGIPVEHVDLELRRAAFRSPVEVEISGLAPLLPLFDANR